MNFLINKNKLLTNTEEILTINKINNLVEVTVDAPISSLVLIKVENLNTPHEIPLYFDSVSDSGNVFKGRIVFLPTHLQWLKDHQRIVLTCKFIINNCEVDGFFSCHVNPQLVYDGLKIGTALEPLYKELASIKSSVQSLQYNYQKFNKTSVDLKKGMTPIATGVGSNYIWDYPLSNLYNKIKELSDIITQLSNAQVNIINRINDLEQKVIDHIYEQYNL